MGSPRKQVPASAGLVWCLRTLLYLDCRFIFRALPIPGVTDIMLVLFAAQKTHVFLLVLLSTAGSAVEWYFSVTRWANPEAWPSWRSTSLPASSNASREWMENHAILSVALPALLPPPMPLSPFVLAAGALKMSRSKFMTTFTISRLIRHSLAVYPGSALRSSGPAAVERILAKVGNNDLIVVWSAILISCAIAFWKLYKTSRSVGIDRDAWPHRRLGF